MAGLVVVWSAVAFFISYVMHFTVSNSSVMWIHMHAFYSNVWKEVEGGVTYFLQLYVVNVYDSMSLHLKIKNNI